MLLKAAMPFNFSSPEYLSPHKRRKNWVSPVSRASPAHMKSPSVVPSIIYGQGRNLNNNWGRDVYSYIRVVPDGFLLESTQIQKKSVGQNMNIWINTLPHAN